MTDKKTQTPTDAERLERVEALLSKIAERMGIEVGEEDEFTTLYKLGKHRGRQVQAAAEPPPEWEGK